LGLRSTEARPKTEEHDVDSNHFRRWDWVMNEMIWAFEQVLAEDDQAQFWEIPPELDLTDRPEDEGKDAIPVRWITEGKCNREAMDAHNARKQRGFELFGKYFQTLWD